MKDVRCGRHMPKFKETRPIKFCPQPLPSLPLQKGTVAGELLGSLVGLECKARFEKQWDVKLGKQSETRS